MAMGEHRVASTCAAAVLRCPGGEGRRHGENKARNLLGLSYKIQLHTRRARTGLRMPVSAVLRWAALIALILVISEPEEP